MKFNVHLYCVVRVHVKDIEASSHEEAVEKARELEEPNLAHRFCGKDQEYADEICDALVDVPGDPDYRRTKWLSQESVYTPNADRETVLRDGDMEKPRR